MKIFRVLLWFLLAMAPSSSSWANSTPIHVYGVDIQKVTPIKNPHVRMVREIVKIDCAWISYTVQADFWFKNMSDQEQAIQFGFPVDYYVYTDNEVVDDILNSFSVRWQGKPVECTRAKLQKESGKDPVYFRQWLCWSVTLGPNEEAHNRVSYSAQTTWTWFGGGFGDPSGESSYLKYVLKTGAAWAGPIESSIVKINYNYPIPGCFDNYDGDDNTPPPIDALRIYPENYSIDEETHTVTWEFKDFMPDKDIFFGWADVPDFSKLDKQPPNDFEEIPAKQGDVEK